MSTPSPVRKTRPKPSSNLTHYYINKDPLAIWRGDSFSHQGNLSPLTIPEQSSPTRSLSHPSPLILLQSYNIFHPKKCLLMPFGVFRCLYIWKSRKIFVSLHCKIIYQPILSFMDYQKSSFSRPCAMGRSELAQQYFPHLEQKCAWQKLRHWLFLNPRLRPLTVIRRHTFSPQEVQLIYEELGEP